MDYSKIEGELARANDMRFPAAEERKGIVAARARPRNEVAS